MGPNGRYLAGESRLFSQRKLMLNEGNQALGALTDSLLRDGWDHVGKHGLMDWHLRFRRLVRT
jgi:hypothetical protein